MRVNLATNVNTLSGEMPAAKSSENANQSAASTFFAQIGRILNGDDESGSSQADEKPAEDAAEKNSAESLVSSIGFPGLPVKMAEPETAEVPCATGSFLSMFPDNTGTTARASNGADSSGAAVSCATASEVLTATAADAGQGAPERPRDFQNPLNPSPSVPPDSSPNGPRQSQALKLTPLSKSEAAETSPAASVPVKMQAANGDFDIPDNLQASPDPLPDGERVLSGSKQAAPTDAGQVKERNDQVTRENPQDMPVLPGFRKGSPRESHPDLRMARPDLPDSSRGSYAAERARDSYPAKSAQASASLEFTKGFAFQENPKAASVRNSVFGESAVSPETNTRGENSPISVSLKTEESTGRMLDDANAGDGHASQNAPRTARPAWTALQGELEGGSSGNSRTQGAGSRRDAFFAPLSGSARGIGSNNPAASSAGQMQGAPPRDFVFQVSERIQYLIREGKGELRVQLKPANLGRIEIRAESVNQGVLARITTESASVKSYLENNLHLLQQTLQDQGLKVERIQIVVQDGMETSFSSDPSTQFGNTGSRYSDREYGESGPLPGSATNPLEEISVDPATWMALNPSIRFYTIA